MTNAEEEWWSAAVEMLGDARLWVYVEVKARTEIEATNKLKLLFVDGVNINYVERTDR